MGAGLGEVFRHKPLRKRKKGQARPLWVFSLPVQSLIHG